MTAAGTCSAPAVLPGLRAAGRLLARLGDGPKPPDDAEASPCHPVADDRCDSLRAEFESCIDQRLRGQLVAVLTLLGTPGADLIHSQKDPTT